MQIGFSAVWHAGGRARSLQACLTLLFADCCVPARSGPLSEETEGALQLWPHLYNGDMLQSTACPPWPHQAEFSTQIHHDLMPLLGDIPAANN